jgi:hypothetical protein
MKKRIISLVVSAVLACTLALLFVSTAGAQSEPFEPYFDEEKGMWCIDETTTYESDGSRTVSRLYSGNQPS